MIGIASDTIEPGDRIWEADDKSAVYITRSTEGKCKVVVESTMEQYEPIRPGQPKTGLIPGYLIWFNYLVRCRLIFARRQDMTTKTFGSQD
jgi:hypothetical protein